MRNNCEAVMSGKLKFLSIQAQDFIEESGFARVLAASLPKFLSIQAQDFIEDSEIMNAPILSDRFLSIQAQDFIEERNCAVTAGHNGDS